MSGPNGVPHPVDEQPSPEDVELGQALESYLAAMEVGRPPDPEQLLAAHPAVADRLRACLAGLRLVEGGAASLGGPAPEAADGDAPPQCLGDFRLVREVGRGGMGVVYEAEQVSLGRRVALKVLPLAATLGGTQLQRFHNEARAAAGLHHTNIVPVYFVGCERGVHFYAMQFIDGRSLADVLAQLRRPTDRATSPQAADTPTTAHVPLPAAGEANGTASTQPAALLYTAGGVRGREYFRAVAELGVQAAEALDYGHRVGVVHRDVKPGNLLLDGAGRLWVTDFGLAQVRGGEDLTATGELVGTLRYMSPEQALGKRVVIDHRTDVYSLGATLYELLALRPPFGGSDRQELLRQIAFDEPLPPRRLNRVVPAELEVIALKALEKAPQDRYATAQELADDLRRWLDDRPIQARRPSWARVASRWARRHKPLVGAVAAVLLMAVVLGGGVALWWVQKRAVAEGEARAALREANGLLEQERWPEALSAARRAEGVLAGVGADPRLRRQVHELIRDLEMARRLQEARLQGSGGVKNGQFDNEGPEAAYATAFQEYGLDVDGLNPQAAAELVRARPIYRQLVGALDDWARARQSLDREGWRRCLAVARAADPDTWRNRLRDVLEGTNSQALEGLPAAHQTGDWPSQDLMLLAATVRGTALGEPTIQLLRRAQQRHPDDFWLNQALGELLFETQPRSLEAAIRFQSIAVALRPNSPGAHLNLGLSLQTKGRLDEAVAEYREVLRLKKDYSEGHYDLANALREKGRLDDAIREYREALSTGFTFKKYTASVHVNLGALLCDDERDYDGAITEFREALGLAPDLPEAHKNLACALFHKGVTSRPLLGKVGFHWQLRHVPVDGEGLLGDNMERPNTMFAQPRRPQTMIAADNRTDNPPSLGDLADQLLTYVRTAATQGIPAHEAERGIWQRLLALGRTALGQFFAGQGTGDLGDTVTLPDGPTWERLPALHTRRYLSIFGEFQLTRTAYGSREGQKIEFVPLDNRWQLPESAFSYVLQDWDQGLCVEQAFGQAQSTVARILNFQQSVASLEHMNLQMAEQVTDFRENRPQPDPATEGPILVTSGDGKGIVLRRSADDPAPAAHRSKGQKASQKRMATVGTAYTVGRYVRTAEQVVAALFRDGPEPPPRPRPCHKRVWASLSQEGADGAVQSGLDIVYDWLLNEVAERNPGLTKEMVHLGDGQESLWQARQDHLPARNTTDILDLLHVTPRLWQAAHVFYPEGSDGAEAFARERIVRVLRGEVAGVVQGLRRMGTQWGLKGSKKKTLAQVCAYLSKNRERMRYDEYLAQGYPIASGVIEGACRHLVKDRMERAGMHWTPAGAQAMLDVRSTYVNGDWEEYQAYRIGRETQRLYPHRHLVEGPQFCMAA